MAHKGTLFLDEIGEMPLELTPRSGMIGLDGTPHLQESSDRKGRISGPAQKTTRYRGDPAVDFAIDHAARATAPDTFGEKRHGSDRRNQPKRD